MTSAQKVIKYLAIAFAIFLIITIISGILSAFYGMAWILGLRDENENVQKDNEMTIINFEDSNIVELDIDVAYSNLALKTGEVFRVETNNTNIISKQSNQCLYVKENSHNWFSNYDDNELIIYIPEGIVFDRVKINTGAGKISIENLSTESLSFKLGAGETEIESLNVSKKCNINGGAGKFSILSGEINDLDLDMGVGETNLSMILTGRSEIDAGVGKLDIHLQQNKEYYKIKVDKGIGSIRIDGKEISDNEIYGNGENYIDIDGGIGNISIDFLL